ncbi:MAG: ABC transporter permease [Bacteroidota bacterium]
MKSDSPNKYLLQFFRWFCHPDYAEDIEGDLHEKYEHYALSHSKRKADWLFFWSVLSLFRPSLMRPISIVKYFNHPFMLRQNLKIGYRNLLKNKGYSAIKIGGFALGIAACLLIALFIKDELSYDTHYPESDRIYRVYMEYKIDDKIGAGSSIAPPLAAVLTEEIPEIEIAGQITGFQTLDGPGSNQFRRADQQQNTYETGFAYADQGMLDIFQFPLRYGDIETAFSEPNTIVMSEDKAQKYFPNKNPIGQTVILNDNTEQPFTITGVLAGNVGKSHLPYDFYLSKTGHEFWQGEGSNWGISLYDGYVKVKQGVDIVAVEKKIASIVRNYIAPVKVQAGYYEKIEEVVDKEKIRLQAVDEVYLYSLRDGIRDRYAHGDIRLIWLFALIAFFILLLAAINFVNLSTAKSANRAKEVGVRKVLGSVRRALIGQFLAESLLFAFFALIIGVLFAYAFLPFFNQIAAKTIVFPWKAVWFLPTLVLATLAIGIVAGLYPAFYLSSFQPIDSLKGKSTKVGKGKSFQNGLIVFQFVTAIVLIVGTLVVNRQMNFILNKDIGFVKDQIILLQGVQTLGNKIPILKEALTQLPEVKNASLSNYLPIEKSNRSTNPTWIEGQRELGQHVSAQTWRVDHDYLKTMGIKLVEGRDFDIQLPTDSQATIINQTMAKKLNVENPIGAKLETGFFPAATVIGVMEDFHFESFERKIEPLYLIIHNSPQTLSLRIGGDNISDALPVISAVWDKLSPNQPIRYAFMDNQFAAMYEDVERLGWIFSSFSILAIVIACLGLFALAAYLAEQRSKEMAIRKVLGASIANIFGLLTQTFFKLIIVALVIAIPAAYFMMQRWLQNYEYQAVLGVEIFALAAAAIVLIALFSLSYQALRAATENPIKAIKTE